MCSTSCSAKGWPIKHNGVQTKESFMVLGVMESEETRYTQEIWHGSTDALFRASKKMVAGT